MEEKKTNKKVSAWKTWNELKIEKKEQLIGNLFKIALNKFRSLVYLIRCA